MSRPFIIIPWQNDFSEELKKLILEKCGGRPEDAIVIFPHTRPKRYLADAFRRDESLPRPLLLPRMLTLRELFEYCRTRLGLPPARPVSMPDAVTLLYRCILNLTPENAAYARLREMDIAEFFPWGVRLFNLIEECLAQGVLPKDIVHARAEVAPLPASLLGMLGVVHEAFTEALRKKGCSTPGLDAFDTAQRAARLKLFPGKILLLAGFAALNGTEEKLLRQLWEKGAFMVLHGDPTLAEIPAGSRAHWSCEDHAALLRRRQAKAELFGKPEQRETKLHFLAGHDLHSQLAALARILENDEEAPSTAVVLSNPSLLMPVLHHLPRKDVNISMGLPLEYSALWRLAEILFRLGESRRKDGRYHYRILSEFLRHPYLRALKTENFSLRDALQVLEDLLGKSGRFADPYVLLKSAGFEPEIYASCLRLLDSGPGALAEADTPRAFSLALEGFCRLLLEQGEALWRAYPLDAECLFRLMEEVLPALRDHEAADTIFPFPFLRALALECVRAERVPFEADPITGLQVLGMLETRLLRFDRVFILDAVDDRLPGAPRQDPLLPDALRAALDLPHTNRRDRMVAHTLRRLLAGAKEAYFFWQEGSVRTTLFDGKKQRSRFVEELLWEEEKREGRLFVSGSPPIESAPVIFTPPERTRRAFARTPALDAAVRRILMQPLSAAVLNEYLRCPLRFVWERLCRIRPLKEVNEGDDPAAVGNLVHEALYELFKPRLGKVVRRRDIGEREVRACFGRVLDASDLRESLPFDSLAMLEFAGPEHLCRFFDRQPEETRVLALEREFVCEIDAPGGRYVLKGTVDRLDLRDGVLVLDYKTGALPALDPDVWKDDTFWNRLETWDGVVADPLPELAERVPDVQLPCYTLLCACTEFAPEGLSCNAAWVDLRDTGEERPLFVGGAAEMERRELLRRAALLVRTLVRHMECAPFFSPCERKHCEWCPYAGLCLR